MFVSLRMMTLPVGREGERDGLVAALNAVALPAMVSHWCAPVSPVAVINAGDVVWRLVFATERDALAAPSSIAWQEQVAPLIEDAQITHVGYRITRSAVRPAEGGIWRALIFRVVPEGFPDRAKALEDGLLMMPGHVATIRSWALSPVSLCEGAKAFTHVWEQELDGLEGLTGEYMTHPIHWGLVDAFFDADCPEYIVDPHLIQVVGTIDRTIMGVHA